MSSDYLRSVELQFGTIEKTATADNDIVNKASLDAVVSGGAGNVYIDASGGDPWSRPANGAASFIQFDDNVVEGFTVLPFSTQYTAPVTGRYAVTFQVDVQADSAAIFEGEIGFFKAAIVELFPTTYRSEVAAESTKPRTVTVTSQSFFIEAGDFIRCYVKAITTDQTFSNFIFTAHLVNPLTV